MKFRRLIDKSSELSVSYETSNLLEKICLSSNQSLEPREEKMDRFSSYISWTLCLYWACMCVKESFFSDPKKKKKFSWFVIFFFWLRFLSDCNIILIFFRSNFIHCSLDFVFHSQIFSSLLFFFLSPVLLRIIAHFDFVLILFSIKFLVHNAHYQILSNL